jgi:NAD(P)-dependent dehydrogenase (short-subunit alcohol dehydrogenase family)
MAVTAVTGAHARSTAPVVAATTPGTATLSKAAPTPGAWEPGQPLVGKVALVTGASKGIGRGIAIAMAQAGADVTVNYHTDPGGAQETAAAIAAAGRQALAVQADVSDRVAVERMVDAVLERFGRLDILVNNAAIGIGHQGSFADYPLDAWRRVFAVNLDGVVSCTQFALRAMQRQGEGGRIINLTSAHSLVFQRRVSAYVVAKGALNTLTQSLAVECGAVGVTVNAIAAGAVSTPGWPASERGREAWNRRAPVSRLGVPEDMAAAAVFLASPAASYITGEILCVDGGYTRSVTPVER